MILLIYIIESRHGNDNINDEIVTNNNEPQKKRSRTTQLPSDSDDEDQVSHALQV